MCTVHDLCELCFIPASYELGLFLLERGSSAMSGQILTRLQISQAPAYIYVYNKPECW